MKDLHYFAAWTDSGCLLGCSHEHKTVAAAAACANVLGGFVVAVENGKLRELNEQEEDEFQRSRYGAEAVPAERARSGFLVQVSMLIRIQVDLKS
jgi:hypothetical protein